MSRRMVLLRLLTVPNSDGVELVRQAFARQDLTRQNPKTFPDSSRRAGGDVRRGGMTFVQ